MESRSSRRSFLKAVGLGAGGIALSGCEAKIRPEGNAVGKSDLRVANTRELSTNVELSELLENPEEYDGQNIETKGWVRGGVEWIRTNTKTGEKYNDYGLRLYTTSRCDGNSIFLNTSYSYEGNLPYEMSSIPCRYLLQGIFVQASFNPKKTEILISKIQELEAP